MGFTDQLWNTKQTAQFLGREPQTLHIWRCEGKGPEFLKDELTGRVYYRPETVKQWAIENLKPRRKTS